MADKHGFLDDMRGFLSEAFKDAKSAVGNSLETLKAAPAAAVNTIAGTVVDQVTTQGLSGRAAESLSGRAAQINRTLDAGP
jgi:hypothetical protein